MPLVSVIVPNYNHAKYLVKRMESILNQTFDDFEIIILDDCSNDDSKQIIESYRSNPKVSTIIYNNINGGTSYKQWNKGIAYANGELIWIAESDDLADIHFLEYSVVHFQNLAIVLTFCGVQFFNVDPTYCEPLGLNKHIIYNGKCFIKNRMLWGNDIYNASQVVFRKNAFQNILDNRWHKMKLAGDWMLWVLLIDQGYLVEIKSVMDYCRRHDENATNRFRKLGCDFTEGVKVLNLGIGKSNGAFDKQRVYNQWYFNFCRWTQNSSIVVKIKIIVVILLKRFDLGVFMCSKVIKKYRERNIVY